MLDRSSEHEDSGSIIESAVQVSVGELFSPNGNNFFIPLYQREYVWEQKERVKPFYDDINDNPEGYFIGSIICVPQNDKTLELIDGQQRVTTLSLLFAAIYKKLSSLRGYNENLCNEYQAKLKQMLILDSMTPRLIPQMQNSNKEDYCAILQACELKIRAEKLPHAGNRRIFKTCSYFEKQLERKVLAEKGKNKIVAVINFLEKILKANLIVIKAKDRGKGYILFDSLNNRSEPLNHIDIIKNNLLFDLQKLGYGNMQAHASEWTQLLNLLNNDFTIQERFTRHYYNANIERLADIGEEKFAMKANRIGIYEKLIANDAEKLLEDLLEAGRYYNRFFDYKNDRHDDMPRELKKAFQNLDRIKGSPSYLLLLHLYLNQERVRISDEGMTNIVNSLIKFFVRRNLLGSPPTSGLDSMFVEIIELIRTYTGEDVIKIIKRELCKKSSDRDDFYKKLMSETLYEDKKSVVRFILCYLEENRMTIETERDLWCKGDRQHTFTIEHIFQQGKNMRGEWVEMIADGDKENALEYQRKYVHKLGNLTLTGFNSTLGDAGFLEKRDRIDSNGLPIGYKNGLWLNEDLAITDHWSVEQINNRTEKLAKECLRLFALDDSEL